MDGWMGRSVNLLCYAMLFVFSQALQYAKEKRPFRSARFLPTYNSTQAAIALINHCRGLKP